FQIQTQQLSGPEPGENKISIRNAARRSQIVFRMDRLKVLAGVELILPEQTSIQATEALHGEPDLVIGRSPGFGIICSAIVDGSFTNLSGQENPIVPDDRRRGAAPGQDNL